MFHFHVMRVLIAVWWMIFSLKSAQVTLGFIMTSFHSTRYFWIFNHKDGLEVKIITIVPTLAML